MRPHAWEKSTTSIPTSHGSSWAVCHVCDALIVVMDGADMSRAHEGWKMSEDCDEQIVIDIMEL